MAPRRPGTGCIGVLTVERAREASVDERPGPLGLKAAWMARTVATVRNGRTAKDRTGRREMVGAHMAELRADVAAMADRLTTEDEWLTAHPRHRDAFAYEDAWLGRLLDYEAGCDAIRAAEREVVG